MNDIDKSNAIEALMESRKFNRPRKKLWELDPQFHCLVIGTCLTMEELRRLSRKAGISVGARMTDYELHHNFVQVARNPVFAARVMHKWLDKKFETAISRFGAYKQAAHLQSLSDEMTHAGNMAGAFWALITHGFAEAALLHRVYGEVHMLSHLAGHSNHSARHELAALKRRVTELEEALAWTASATRLRVQELERRAEALAERARRMDALERELAATRTRLPAAESEARKWSVRAMRAAGCPRVQAADAGRQMSPAMPALEHRSPPDDLVGAG